MIEIRSLRDLVRLFFIFRNEFRLAAIATIVVAALGAYVWPARYQSDARLLVQAGRETSTLPIELEGRSLLFSPSTQRDPILDEEMLLTGSSVVHDVAFYYYDEIVNAPRQPGFWNSLTYFRKKAVTALIGGVRAILVFVRLVDEQSPVDRLALKLKSQFTAAHEPGSAVIAVSFKWDDPAIAQKIVDKWVQVYLDQRASALARKSLYGFYEEQAQKTAQQIADDKIRISDYLQTIDGTSTRDRLDRLSSRVAILSSERGEASAELAALQSGIGSATEQMHQQPDEVITQRDLSQNPNWLSLQQKLHDVEVQRLEKLRIYREGSPQIQEMDEAIASVKALIAAEQETSQRSELLSPNQITQGLRKSAAESSVKASELKARLAAYDSQLDQLRSERHRILSVEPPLSLLEGDLTVAEKNHALYLDSLEKARIDHELDLSRINNIAVVQKASLNPSRVFPKRLLTLLLAVPAGMGVGLLVIYLCYLLDQRIHDGGLVEQRFGIPLWTNLPELDAQESLPISFAASLYRMYSLLPLDLVRDKGLNIGIVSSRQGEGVSFVAGQLSRILAERGFVVRIAGDDAACAAAGEVTLIEAAALPDNQDAFVRLRNADLILMVIEARRATIPTVENTLSILRTAFRKVDGIIINRRSYEIPSRLLSKVMRWTAFA